MDVAGIPGAVSWRLPEALQLHGVSSLEAEAAVVKEQFSTGEERWFVRISMIYILRYIHIDIQYIWVH